jgi:hypothetical protein
MPTYLHAIVAGPEELVKHVVEHTPESLHLDFKREFWKDEQRNNNVVRAQEEAAKDVAAFANAEGGDIIVGITDHGHRAGAFFDTPNVVGVEPQLREWLRNRLAPREVAETVAVKLFEFDHDNKHRHVLVVTIPPWPNGPVSVWDGDADKAGYFFPVRRGDDTGYLRFEELMRLSDPKKRSTFLRLQELEHEERRFALTSPIRAKKGRIVALMPMAVNCHGQIRVVDPDVVVFEMIGAIEPLSITFPAGGTLQSTEIAVEGGRSLAVPLELVRAAWRDPDGARLLQIAVDGTIVWERDRWNLVIGEQVELWP